MRRLGRRTVTVAAMVLFGAVGTQLIVANAASAHTPSASISCSSWSIGGTNYDPAEHNTYSYSIDGGPTVSGTFGSSFGPFSGTFPDGSGNHSLIGHVYQNADPSAQYSHDYNLHTDSCANVNTIPIPAAPAPSAPTCTAPGAATVPPDTDDVHWTLSGNVATATAQGGNHFTDGTTTKSFTENPLPQLDADDQACARHITVAAPVFTNGSCTSAPTLGGAVAGTGYTVAVVGTPDFGATVTVTFTATAGYRLDGQTVYSFTYAGRGDCRPGVAAVSPTVTQASCDHHTGTVDGFTITPAVTEHITYTLNGLTVTATAADGFKLIASQGWTSTSDTSATFTVTRDDPQCLIDIAPATPSVAQATCVAPGQPATRPSIELANTPHVTYSAGQSGPAAGTTVTVTASAASGYEFTSATLPAGWTLADGGATATSATLRVVLDAAPICDAAVAPSFADDRCLAPGSTGSSFTIAAGDGVTYFVDGVELSPGVHAAADGSSITVTAQAPPGHRLMGPASWTHQFGSKPSCHTPTGTIVEPPVTEPGSPVVPVPNGNPPVTHPVTHLVTHPVTSSPQSSTPGRALTSTPGLALTGLPIGVLLILGSVLALLGVALTLNRPAASFLARSVLLMRPCRVYGPRHECSIDLAPDASRPRGDGHGRHRRGRLQQFGLSLRGQPHRVHR